MRLSQAKDYLPFVQAAAEGKTIQVRNISGRWMDLQKAEFDEEIERYRIKPEPKLRPWRPEEVPVGALMRGKYPLAPRGACVILSVSKDSLDYVSDRHQQYSLGGALKYLQHSIDNGKTWLPCGVMEDEQ